MWGLENGYHSASTRHVVRCSGQLSVLVSCLNRDHNSAFDLIREPRDHGGVWASTMRKAHPSFTTTTTITTTSPAIQLEVAFFLTPLLTLRSCSHDDRSDSPLFSQTNQLAELEHGDLAEAQCPDSPGSPQDSPQGSPQLLLPGNHCCLVGLARQPRQSE